MLLAGLKNKALLPKPLLWDVAAIPGICCHTWTKKKTQYCIAEMFWKLVQDKLNSVKSVTCTYTHQPFKHT